MLRAAVARRRAQTLDGGRRERRTGLRAAVTSLAVVVAGPLGAVTIGVLAATTASAAVVCPAAGGAGAGGTLTGVVNTYYPGVGTAAAGATQVDVGAPSGAATAVAPGDLLLLIQVQDAQFDSSNTLSYGHGGAPANPAAGYTSLDASGLYEYVHATSAVAGGAVQVAGAGAGGGLLNTYTEAAATSARGQRTFELVRVPSFTSATTSSGLTAAGWNGSTGGVLALDVSGALDLAGTVSVDGLGFRGGAGLLRVGGVGLSAADTAVSATAGADGNKAEGIGGTPLGTTAGNGYPGGDAARGAPGNAGGGGTDAKPSVNSENSGGGGGGNGGTGGDGGNSWNSDQPTGGWGGVGLPASGARVFLGGGGGAATANNFPAPAAAGASGGGIVLVRAGSVTGSGTITAGGADAYQNTPNDGGGGGGAGGAIVVTSASGTLSGATLRANGGMGGDAWHSQPPGAGNISAHGPGGGGGGGWVLTSGAAGSTSVSGGVNGTTTSADLVYGSTPGTPGHVAASGGIPGVAASAECADLSVAKTGAGTVAGGQQATYHLTVSNGGNVTATGVRLVDTLAAEATFVSASGSGWSCTHAGNTSVTCTRASLAVGASATVVVVVGTPAAAASLTDTATVSAITSDPDAANNQASATTVVTAPVTLAMTGSAVGGPLAGGVCLLVAGIVLLVGSTFRLPRLRGGRASGGEG
jgi:uncharacterized repeat protein (TIGR01451 family)